MKRLVILCLALMTAAAAIAQPQANYYTASTLDGKNGRQLEIALKNIVGPHTKLSYDDLTTYFKTTDVVPQALLTDPSKTNQVYDMYSNWYEQPLYYNGSGFNKEHSLPKSWWGGNSNNAYSDLHHLTPSESTANSAKSNYPLGEYNSETMSSTTPVWTNDWSKVWATTSNASGYGGGCNRVWEPNDEYKGDFARMYLHVVCAYEGELSWDINYMFTNQSGTPKYTNIKPWALELLLKWHRQDPVSQKELDRNNAIETFQHNRNPFIDYPELVEFIWGNRQSEQFCLANAHLSYDPVDPVAPTFELVMTATVGHPFTGMTLTTTSDGAVTYSSSNTSVASVNATTGEVTIVAEGTAIITATTAETSLYNQSTASYKIVVTQ